MGLSFFIAPPWGTALDEIAGLDLRCTPPPVTDIIGYIARAYPSQRVLLAIQVYEKLNLTSLRDVQALLGRSELRVYDLNDASKNHGILLRTTAGNADWKCLGRPPQAGNATQTEAAEAEVSAQKRAK